MTLLVGGRGIGWHFTCCLWLCVSAAAQAQDNLPFTVADIRVEGLQRISEGAVFTALPVDVGDILDTAHAREALRAVYDTGFFRDVELRRDGEVLLVVVRERPSIRSFSVAGNKEIKSDELLKSLRNVGLANGRIFNRSTLEDVRQFLTEQYYSRGRYSVRVDPTVEELPGNLVDVRVDIDEGRRARIRDINITGNTRFSDQELLRMLELGKTNLLSFYRGDDKYSKQQLEGDLERIRSWYLDRGYADFEITSTQVALAPGKDDLYITVNVFEGATWKTGAVKLAGRFAVPEIVLRQYLQVHPGDLYSQHLIASSEEAIRNRLGEAGFAFAQVTAVPAPDPVTHEISLTFEVEPNARTYVRHIDFKGVEKTRDDVLRREVRQLEGGTLSNGALLRSEERLKQLPFLENVEFETHPVEGTRDLVDVDFSIEERASSQVSGGIGYSERQSVMLNGSLVDSNLFGSGNRLALEFNGGRYGRIFSVAHTDPYFTADGVSRSLSASYVEQERLTSSFSQFSTETYSAGFAIGYPLAEEQSVNFGLTWSHADLSTVYSSSTQLRDWVRNNGDDYYRRVGSDPVLGTIVDTLELTASWLHDSRDRYLFATRGSMYRLNLSITPPGGSVEFALANFRSQQFFRLPIPLVDEIPFSLTTNLGWGTALGDTTAIPPNRHVLAGGSDSVRGFRDGTLGPRDSLGNPYGGDAGVSAQLEAIMPLPAKFANSARLSLFVDAGQSYYLGDTTFRNKRGDRVEYPFDLSELRVSAGVSLQWLSPLGLFRLSYAYPLRYQEETRRQYGDVLEEIQFSVGQAF
ncbi:MAG TPA: outer membrane protein assembly factor BamA [Steroidobacteraceae bacterium]|nr:outer membrane protein assembly factor BamA [Steroidobacteraceae bacterium]